MRSARCCWWEAPNAGCAAPWKWLMKKVNHGVKGLQGPRVWMETGLRGLQMRPGVILAREAIVATAALGVQEAVVTAAEVVVGAATAEAEGAGLVDRVPVAGVAVGMAGAEAVTRMRPGAKGIRRAADIKRGSAVADRYNYSAAQNEDRCADAFSGDVCGSIGREHHQAGAR